MVELVDIYAEMVELVDTQVSGTCGVKPVGVQIPLSAFYTIYIR